MSLGLSMVTVGDKPASQKTKFAINDPGNFIVVDGPEIYEASWVNGGTVRSHRLLADVVNARGVKMDLSSNYLYYGGLQSYYDGDKDTYGKAFISKHDAALNQISFVSFWESPCAEAVIEDLVVGNDGNYYACLNQYSPNASFLVKISNDLSSITYVKYDLALDGNNTPILTTIARFDQDGLVLGSNAGDVIRTRYPLDIAQAQQRLANTRVVELGTPNDGSVVVIGTSVENPDATGIVHILNGYYLTPIFTRTIPDIAVAGGFVFDDYLDPSRSMIYVAGTSVSNTGIFEGQNKGAEDIAVVQLDMNLNITGSLLVGGSSYDTAYSVNRYGMAGMIIYGMTRSNDQDIPSSALLGGAVFAQVGVIPDI